MKKNRVKASKIWGIAALVLLVGSVSLLLYPTVSKVINQQQANNLIEAFNEIAEKIDPKSYTDAVQTEESDEDIKTPDSKDAEFIVENTDKSDYSITTMDIAKLYQDSLQYNSELNSRQSFDGIDFSSAALELSDYGIYNGVYGYISIPEIDLQMPILLGSTNQNMAVGVTHLYSTSLPLGGENTNCVISGHTGYTGKTFFDDISNLPVGSTVSVTTLFGTLQYEVTEIKKIEITQTDDLYIEKGMDKLVLLTCADGGERRWQVSCYR